MAKTFGFKLIPTKNLKAVYDHMLTEGTCCWAYGDFIGKHVSMLIAGCTELQVLRSSDSDITDWNHLDNEVCEALIMLRAMVNLTSETLFWCSTCKSVSVQPLTCNCKEGSYGLDFTEEILPALVGVWECWNTDGTRVYTTDVPLKTGHTVSLMVGICTVALFPHKWNDETKNEGNYLFLWDFTIPSAQLRAQLESRISLSCNTMYFLKLLDDCFKIQYYLNR